MPYKVPSDFQETLANVFGMDTEGCLPAGERGELIFSGIVVADDYVSLEDYSTDYGEGD